MLLAVVAVACSGGSDPSLVGAPATATPAPTATPVATVTPAPTSTATPVATVEPTATPTPTATPVPALARGIDDTTLGVAVLKSGAVFGDVEVGVAARLTRTNSDGGIHGRELQLVRIMDDEGDPALAAELAQELVDSGEVFAVVLASAVPNPEVTAIFEQNAMPFFGWGFAPGFCRPNVWGFGFNGCLIGSLIGVPDVEPDDAERRLIESAFGEDVTVAVAVENDASGEAATLVAQQVWSDRLLVTVPVTDDLEAAARALASANPDVVLLSVRLDTVLALRPAVAAVFDGPVVDNVGYLPGLLTDFVVADAVEGGYSVTQFPPQEEYRDITAVIAEDLDAVDAPLVYSQAVSLGYWATDLFVAIADAVGPDIDTATFQRTVSDGVVYDPEVVGAPCPMNSGDLQLRAAGGAALVQVVGGIYRPTVAFDCP